MIWDPLCQIARTHSLVKCLRNRVILYRLRLNMDGGDFMSVRVPK